MFFFSRTCIARRRGAFNELPNKEKRPQSRQDYIKRRKAMASHLREEGVTVKCRRDWKETERPCPPE